MRKRYIEKWENRRDLDFAHLCLVAMMEKQRDEKFIYFEKKNKRMENQISINLQLYPLK